MLLRPFKTEVLISSSFLRELPFFMLDTVIRSRCVSSYRSNSFSACKPFILLPVPFIRFFPRFLFVSFFVSFFCSVFRLFHLFS